MYHVPDALHPFLDAVAGFACYITRVVDCILAYIRSFSSRFLRGMARFRTCGFCVMPNFGGLGLSVDPKSNAQQGGCYKYYDYPSH